MSASSSRIGHTLLGHPSEDNRRVTPCSTDFHSMSLDRGGSIIYNLYITSILRPLAIAFTITSFILYLVVINNRRDTHPAMVIALIPLFSSLLVDLLIGLYGATGRQIKVHYQMMSSAIDDGDKHIAETERGGRLGLPEWDFVIGAAQFLTAGPACMAVHSDVKVIVAVVFNFFAA